MGGGYFAFRGPSDEPIPRDTLLEWVAGVAGIYCLLTDRVDAELLDESGSTLSIQRERYMREEVIQFQHSNLVA